MDSGPAPSAHPGMTNPRNSTPARHLLEPHASAIRHPGRDVTGLKARLPLRYLLLRAAQRLPPRGALGCARQRRIDDFLDLLEAQHEFRQLLLLQVVAQRVVVDHSFLIETNEARHYLSQIR